MTSDQSGRAIVINIDKPAPVPEHPCRYGHRWAWAYLTTGGTAQCCRVCGAER